MKETVEDFWRMVCQYKVEAVVMLTRCVEMGKVSHNIFINHLNPHPPPTIPLLQQKCLQYWPDRINDSISGDSFTTTLTSVLTFADYQIRKLEIKNV